jgi:hypothetical protein
MWLPTEAWLHRVQEPRLRPYRQGALDGLCGIHSVVNAVRYLCGPLSMARSQALFMALLEHMEQRRPLPKCVAHGVMIGEIGGMLGKVVAPRYPVRRCMPFRQNPLVPLDDYWTALQDFLADDKRIVLTAISGAYDHWTLVRHVTDRSMLLFDSTNCRGCPVTTA